MTLLFSASAQPPRPPAPPHPPANGMERLAELRRNIRRQPAVDLSAERALQYARRYADLAEKKIQAGHEAQADRVIAAATALLRVAEHQQHLHDVGGPPLPQPQQIRDHLQRVYFRVEQADYFLEQAHDASAAPLPKWARDFYQLAARALDRSEWVAADENSKCAEDVTAALENLAQAANIPLDAPPPPPLPPAPPHP